MAEVRSSAGVPAASAFGGLGSPSPGTPIVVDSTQGDLYTLVGSTVTKSASAAAGSGLIYAAGAPSNSLGSNGNYYFRSDGTVGSAIYFKSSDTWGAIL